MNQFKVLASAGVVANQYWQLINAMLFNLKTIGYVFVVFISLTLIAVLMSFILPGFYRVGASVTLLSSFILIFVGIMALPMGMLSLLANRHLFTVADIRNKLFVIACVFCVCSSLMFLSPFFIKNVIPSFNLGLYVFFLCALYFWLAIYVCSKRFELLFLVPLAMIAWVKASFDTLVALYPAALLLMALLSWVMFYRWWIAFAPGRHRVKSIFVETDRRKMQESLSLDRWRYFLSNHIKTPVGSLLLGYGDGAASFFKPLIMVYLTTLIFSFFVCQGFVDWQFTDSAFMATVIALGYAFLLSAIGLQAKSMLMNVRRGWLAFSGNRFDLLLYLEHLYFKWLGILIALNAILIILLLWFSNHLHYFVYSIGALLGLSIMAVLLFYLDIYFYKRGPFVPGNINLIKAAVNLICFVPLVCYLVVKYQAFNVFEVRDVVATGLALLVVVSLKTIRSQAINKWQKADF